MEFNREQIEKVLYWLNCFPGNSYDYDSEMAELTLSLVKELTEENERLRDDNLYGLSASKLAKKVEELSRENERLRNRVVCKVVIPDEKLEEIKSECLERVELDIKAIEADTVRKMQSEINKTLSALCKGDVSEIHRMVDQIAKEMVEESK